MARLLSVDDDPAVLFTLREALADRGHDVVTASSGEEALGKLEGADCVLTDLSMPGMDGLQLLARVRERDPSLPVILLTARGSERVAVAAMKAGAHDYLSKPIDLDELAIAVERAVEARELRRVRRRADAERAVGRPLASESAPMRRLLDEVARIAPRDLPVLVHGETGTGKELIASLLHAQGRRASGPLVRFNCAAIPAELAEAELFGHARGAFTGATSARPGFFARASGGTIVLDEIGELPPALQPKLLRTLQDGEIQPVGSGRVEKVDVRVVSCTNRDLLAEARAGRFREDLYYRLAVVTLEVPPLRERREDVPDLARELARRHAERFGLDDVRLSDELVRALAARDWPGNVRELENVLARAVALSEGGLLGPEVLGPAATAANPAPGSFREQVESFERRLIDEALRAENGNQSAAARRLGLSRSALIDRLKKFAG